MAEPWRCPQCLTWIRADVAEHRCLPDGGVTVGISLPQPAHPPASAAVTHPWQWWWSGTAFGAEHAAAVTFLPPSLKLAQMRGGSGPAT